MDKASELKNCNFIKALLMCSVVLCHSMAVYRGGAWSPYEPIDSAPALGYIAEWLNSFHIFCFTLISGYIFYYIKFERGGYQKYLPFLMNKVMRLLVPYAFIAAIWVIPVYVHFYGTSGFVSKYILGTSPSQLWFLLMLFWVFAIFWLISDFVNKKPLLGAVIVLVLYCAGYVAPNYFCFSKGLQYLLFFYIGFIIRKCDIVNKILYKIPSLAYIAANVALFVFIEIIKDSGSTIIKLLSLGGSAVLHVVGAVGCFIILERFVNRFLQKSKVIDFLSKHSMVTYLVHQQLIYFTIGWFNGTVPPIVLVLINFVFSFAVSILFSVLMHKTKMTSILVGSHRTTKQGKGHKSLCLEQN